MLKVCMDAGVIHGQMCILAGTLTVLDIFNGREQFKQHVQVTLLHESWLGVRTLCPSLPPCTHAHVYRFYKSSSLWYLATA